MKQSRPIRILSLCCIGILGEVRESKNYSLKGNENKKKVNTFLNFFFLNL